MITHVIIYISIYFFIITHLCGMYMVKSKKEEPIIIMTTIGSEL